MLEEHFNGQLENRKKQPATSQITQVETNDAPGEKTGGGEREKEAGRGETQTLHPHFWCTEMTLYEA